MIHRQGSVFHARLNATGKIQFIHMDLWPQSILGTGLKQSFCFFLSEKTTIAKDIHEICQFFVSDDRKHFSDQLIDVAVSVVLEFGRNGMRSEECRANGNG